MVDVDASPGFIERLRELIGTDSVSRFANQVGLGDNLIRKYLEGATPGLDKVVRICEAKGVNIAWLALGQGPKDGSTALGEQRAPYQLRDSGSLGEGREILESEDGRQYVLLPRYDIRVSAGGGSVVHSEQIVDYYSFNRRWFESRVAIPPAQAVLLEVHGDSMEPDLFDGDLTLVHTGISSFGPEGIYVFLASGELRIKWVKQRIEDGKIELRSSNPRYETELLSPEHAEQLVIIGRARRRLPQDRRLP